MNNSNTTITDTILNFPDSVNYIETLYLQTNLYSHVNGELSNDKKHVVALNSLYDNVLSVGVYKGFSNGREWYELPDYRIGVILDYDDAVKSNWYSVVIQYKQVHMWAVRNDIDMLQLPLTSDKTLYHIQRADATLIYRSDTDYLNGYGVLSKYRKQTTIENNGQVETKYLGTRASGNMVRWYNKTKELVETENYGKIELLSQYFGDVEDLYTIELEMKRDYLYRTMHIDTLEDFYKLYDAYKNIVGSMRIYELNEENEKHIKSNNRSRIKAVRLAEWVDYKRANRKVYKPSQQYLVDILERSTKRFFDSVEVANKQELGLSIINELLIRLDLGKGMSEIIISFEPSVFNCELQEMKDKHDKKRKRGVA